jgi:hypothetical protein
MRRKVIGIVAGLVSWGALVTVLNLGLRHGWPAYAAVEKAMTFTLAMMAARLLESFVSSLASGWIAARIGGRIAALVAGLLLLLLFVPVHYQLWHVFPVWYHLSFLLSLPLLNVLGGRLVRPASSF